MRRSSRKPPSAKLENPSAPRLDGARADESVPCAEVIADRAARLRADRELRDMLAAEGFAGPAYAVFEEDLASYGYRLMMDWLRSGYIFRQCRQAGVILLSLEIPFNEVEDLAQETVAEALRSFKRKGLQQGGWCPEGGASLKTYFTRALCLQFANIWRRWLRARSVPVRESLETLLSETESPGLGPAETFLQHDEIRRGLADIHSERTRIALVLAEDGYEQEEIAEILGPDVTPRSVEGYLRRHRQRLAIGNSGEVKVSR